MIFLFWWSYWIWWVFDAWDSWNHQVKINLLRKDTSPDRLADSRASPFDTLQLLLCITHYLSYSLSIPFFPALALYIPKSGLHLRVVGQSLHVIIRSGRIMLTRVFTVSFAVILCSKRTRTCASASSNTSFWYMLLSIIPFYYISHTFPVFQLFW
jgi:hypothetical protein